MNKEEAFHIEENLYITLALCFIGGFLDAYTYILYDKIFANTQTGNLIFLTIYFLEGEFYNVVLRILPIFSFCIAIFIIQFLIYKFKNKKVWLKIILFINVLLTFIMGFGVFKNYRIIVISLISFICAITFGSFKKSDGDAFSAVMCTGNLRSLMEFFTIWIIHKEKSYKNKALKFLFLIGSFCFGVGLGIIIVSFFNIYSMFICTIIYLMIFIYVYLKTK